MDLEWKVSVVGNVKNERSPIWKKFVLRVLGVRRTIFLKRRWKRSLDMFKSKADSLLITRRERFTPDHRCRQIEIWTFCPWHGCVCGCFCFPPTVQINDGKLIDYFNLPFSIMQSWWASEREIHCKAPEKVGSGMMSLPYWELIFTQWTELLPITSGQEHGVEATIQTTIILLNWGVDSWGWMAFSCSLIWMFINTDKMEDPYFVSVLCQNRMQLPCGFTGVSNI